MIEEIEAYFEYLSKFKQIERPCSPKFDLQVFKDESYLDTLQDFEPIADFSESVNLDIVHIKER